MKCTTSYTARLLAFLKASHTSFSNQKMAENLGCSLSSIEKGLAFLKKNGFIQLDSKWTIDGWDRTITVVMRNRVLRENRNQKAFVLQHDLRDNHNGSYETTVMSVRDNRKEGLPFSLSHSLSYSQRKKKEPPIIPHFEVKQPPIPNPREGFSSKIAHQEKKNSSKDFNDKSVQKLVLHQTAVRTKLDYQNMLVPAIATLPEFESAWQEYLKKPTGMVKHVRAWLITVIQNARSDKLIHFDRDQVIEKHKKMARAAEILFPQNWSVYPDFLMRIGGAASESYSYNESHTFWESDQIWEVIKNKVANMKRSG